MPTTRTRTYQQIKAEIARLEAQAEEARKSEIKGVIERMKDAITAYKLKPADLFGSTNSAPAKIPTRAAKKKRRIPNIDHKKYGDGNGNFWSGMGRKPAWFQAAVREGKQPSDLLTQKG